MKGLFRLPASFLGINLEANKSRPVRGDGDTGRAASAPPLPLRLPALMGLPLVFTQRELFLKALEMKRAITRKAAAGAL